MINILVEVFVYVKYNFSRIPGVQLVVRGHDCLRGLCHVTHRAFPLTMAVYLKPWVLPNAWEFSF